MKVAHKLLLRGKRTLDKGYATEKVKWWRRGLDCHGVFGQWALLK